MGKKGYIFCYLICLIYLVGCATNSQKNEISTVNIAISGDGNADKLDATAYNSDMSLYGAVYEPLVQYGEKGNYLKGLASSWEIKEDGKKYIFNLNKGVKFSDGSELNAEAVKFTVERAKNNNENSTLQTLANLEKIEIIDDYTIVFIFNKISNQVLAELSQTRPLRIMSPHSVIGNSPKGEFVKSIGTGPFTIKDSSSEEVLMEANPYFNQNNPLNYQVNFKTIQDGSSRMLSLKSGEVDIVGGTLGSLSDNNVKMLENESKYKIHEFKGTMSHFLSFNPDAKLLSSPIRRGIELSINKDNLSSKKLLGLFRENVEYVTSENQKKQSYNIQEGQSIFEAEGFTKSKNGYYEKDGEELVFKLVIQTTEFPEWKQQAEMIESDLKKCGIKVKIEILESGSYYDVLWKTKEFDMIFYRTYTDALLPYNFLNSLFRNTETIHGVLANDNLLSSYLNAYAETIQEEKKQEIFDNIFKYINNETYAIPIDYKDEIFVTSKKITEFHYSGLSDSPIDFVNMKVK